MTSYIGRVRFHRERARLLHLHAGHTKSPAGREVYLRLVRVEVALAEQNELLAQVALEQELAATTQPQPTGSRDDQGSRATGGVAFLGPFRVSSKPIRLCSNFRQL